MPVCAAAAQTFEVAVVRQSRVNLGHDGDFAVDPTRYAVRNATLRRLMVEAWQIPYAQITGGPAWVNSDEFDLDARPGKATSSAEYGVMLRALLAERFRLITHVEQRERKLYSLGVVRGGARLDSPVANAAGTWRFHGTLAEFAARLATQLTIPLLLDPTRPSFATGTAIPVIDKTGVPGVFDFVIDLKAEAGADAFTVWQRALQEQLGLRLDAVKGVAEFLVIDHAEKLRESN